jgi:hypothetical protein
MSLDIPKDAELLKFCEYKQNRYGIAKHFGNHYPSIIQRVEKLVKMGFLKELEPEGGSGPKGKVRFFLTTDSGRAVLRGLMEAHKL